MNSHFLALCEQSLSRSILSRLWELSEISSPTYLQVGSEHHKRGHRLEGEHGKCAEFDGSGRRVFLEVRGDTDGHHAGLMSAKTNGGGGQLAL